VSEEEFHVVGLYYSSTLDIVHVENKQESLVEGAYHECEQVWKPLVVIDTLIAILIHEVNNSLSNKAG
jgi:hypothetical protein